jgi:hypothetical protein
MQCNHDPKSRGRVMTPHQIALCIIYRSTVPQRLEIVDRLNGDHAQVAKELSKGSKIKINFVVLPMLYK